MFIAGCGGERLLRHQISCAAVLSFHGNTASHNHHTRVLLSVCGIQHVGPIT